MEKCKSLLEIRVHLEDGRIARFAQNDPAVVASLFGHIQPSKLFAQPHIALHDDRALTIFPCATIVKIDLIAEQTPEWTFSRGVLNVHEITRDAFLKLSAPAPRPLMYAGDKETGFTEIETVSGQLIYLQLEVLHEPVTAIDRHMVLQQVLTLGGLHWHRHGGGLTIMNPAKIARFAIYPSPSAPAGAWQAERIPE